MRLVYLSPVRWSSFEQRPHKFVRWYHLRTQDSVLWIDPYPARFPRLSDWARIRKQFALSGTLEQPPHWLSVLGPRTLPIEPLPGVAHFNQLLWAGMISEISRFIGSGDAMIVCGKPSLLALDILGNFSQHSSIYDAMDDFPSFHRGLARRALRAREAQLVSRVGAVWASSRKLVQRLSQQRNDVQLVPNGLDPTLLPVPRKRGVSQATPLVFGYVGTMAAWFDWDIIIALALARPQDRIRLVGPLEAGPNRNLPTNVELHPSVPHALALQIMNEFDVGLIPFKCNSLTDSVDPIKYYEYRALGLPVLSTCFGEMANRRNMPGVHLIDASRNLVDAASSAVADLSAFDTTFAERHSWDAVFDAAQLRATTSGGWCSRESAPRQ